MADTGTPGFIPLFDDDSQFTPVQSPLNAQSNALNTALAALVGNLSQNVANQAARDALFPTPVQGNRVFRNDLGYEQVYLNAFDATTAPFGGTTAGWYRSQGVRYSRTNTDLVTVQAGWAVSVVNLVATGSNVSLDMTFNPTANPVATTTSGNSSNSEICVLNFATFRPAITSALSAADVGRMVAGYINPDGGVWWSATVPGYGAMTGDGNFTLSGTWSRP